MPTLRKIYDEYKDLEHVSEVLEHGRLVLKILDALPSFRLLSSADIEG